jgi:long-chain acyl-CoA synthetase
MLTLTSALSRTARLYGRRTAVFDPKESLTWTAFADRIARAGAVLRSLGIAPGERYGLICRNSVRMAELMHAGYWVGAIPVPINFRLAPPEIAYLLDNAACKLVVLEDDLAEAMASEPLAPWSEKAVLLGTRPAEAPWPRHDALMTQAEPADPADPLEQDEALLLYTGGTTGRAKGVPLSHLNIVSNALQLGIELGPRSSDVYLHVAPMFHSADLLANPYVLVGAAQVYLPRFSAQAVLEAIQTFGITVTLMTPTMLIMTLQEPNFDRYDLSSLRQVIYGSSPMAVKWIRKMLERFKGVELVQAYGLTETSPILTLLPMAAHEEAVESGADGILKSVGAPVQGVDMRILDAEGRELPAEEPGEVVVRGPNVVKGYLKRPDADAESFRDGWFHTGDIGRIDRQGNLYLLDRMKDMIITGGEMVFSAEVEAALYENPEVHECAVIGVPDETYGEALLAAIVPAPGATPSEEELIAQCRGIIGGYKIPRRYVFLDRLPKSAMNKVLKTELRRIYGKKA